MSDSSEDSSKSIECEKEKEIVEAKKEEKKAKKEKKEKRRRNTITNII
ncbi:Hypothetical protein EIN_085420, partial [Entamoeba invadens IP1]